MISFTLGLWSLAAQLILKSPIIVPFGTNLVNNFTQIDTSVCLFPHQTPPDAYLTTVSALCATADILYTPDKKCDLDTMLKVNK